MNIKSIIGLLSFSLLFFACNEKNTENTKSDSIDTVQIVDSIESEKSNPEEFSNERFRQVTIEKIGEHKFQVLGQAQVFEGTLNWVVEDGHNELKKGFTTAEAGAPEWSKFDFTVDVEKRQENSTLNLILFELSAKDGSRKNELFIPLQF